MFVELKQEIDIIQLAHHNGLNQWKSLSRYPFIMTFSQPITPLDLNASAGDLMDDQIQCMKDLVKFI